MQEPAIQKAIEIESIFTKDEVLRREYEQREKAIMDYNSAMSASRRNGIKEVALSMLKENLPIEIICKCTNLSKEELFSLQKHD